MGPGIWVPQTTPEILDEILAEMMGNTDAAAASLSAHKPHADSSQDPGAIAPQGSDDCPARLAARSTARVAQRKKRAGINRLVRAATLVAMLALLTHAASNTDTGTALLAYDVPAAAAFVGMRRVQLGAFQRKVLLVGVALASLPRAQAITLQTQRLTWSASDGARRLPLWVDAVAVALVGPGLYFFDKLRLDKTYTLQHFPEYTEKPAAHVVHMNLPASGSWDEKKVVEFGKSYWTSKMLAVKAQLAASLAQNREAY